MTKRRPVDAFIPGLDPEDGKTREIKKLPTIKSFTDTDKKTISLNFDAIGEYFYLNQTAKLNGIYSIEGGNVIDYDGKLYFCTSDEGKQTLKPLKEGVTLQELQNLFPTRKEVK